MKCPARKRASLMVVGAGVAIGLVGSVSFADKLKSSLSTAASEQPLPAGQPPDVSERTRAQDVLRRFALAVAEDRPADALALLPTREQMATIMPADRARAAADGLRTLLEKSFPEFVAAHRAFGECEIFDLEPGVPRKMGLGEQGLTAPVTASERGHISFARKSEAFIELRFRVGGMLKLPSGQWVLTNMSTRAEEPDRLGKPQPSGSGR